MIIVSPFSEVYRLLVAYNPSHVLSLISPEAEALSCDGYMPAHRLTLRFNDITSPKDGLVEPTTEIVEEMIDFMRGWDRQQPFFVHCWAGVSRSTAAAYILACRWVKAGAEVDVAIRLRAASPSAQPNPLMVALADDLLGRAGRMTAAIDAIGPGVIDGEAQPFTLDL